MKKSVLLLCLFVAGISACAVQSTEGFYGQESSFKLDNWTIFYRIEHHIQTFPDTIEALQENDYTVMAFAQRKDSTETPLNIVENSIYYDLLERPIVLNQKKRILLSEYPEILPLSSGFLNLDDLPDTIYYTYYYYFGVINIPQNIESIDVVMHFKAGEEKRDEIRKFSLMRENHKSFELLLD